MREESCCLGRRGVGIEETRNKSRATHGGEERDQRTIMGEKTGLRMGKKKGVHRPTQAGKDSLHFQGKQGVEACKGKYESSQLEPHLLILWRSKMNGEETRVPGVTRHFPEKV